ncbi:lysophospholipid acyltransferase family protein [Nocardia sp. NPDC049526]|uniref:lysophospholipid acyltransferase family protein n=1 Tax=Nocardia sp. NPDC049526 TaxID=3364316 RepID=UPI0037890901
MLRYFRRRVARTHGDRTYHWTLAATEFAIRVMGIRLDIRGGAHIPAAGGAIIAANHISYLDPFCVALPGARAGRWVRFAGLPEQFEHRLYGPLMRSLHCIRIRPGGGTSAEIADRLRGGEVVGLFPEATIARSFTVQRLRLGAAQLALTTGVPLVPMALWGPQRLYTKGFRHLGRRRVAVTVLIGEPLSASDAADPHELTAILGDRMQQLLDEAQRTYPDDGSGQWWQPCHLGGTAPDPERAAALDAAEERE